MQAISRYHELPDLDMEFKNVLQMLTDPNFSFKEYSGKPKSLDDMSHEEREKHREEQKIINGNLLLEFIIIFNCR